jgi:hypothetical protein
MPRESGASSKRSGWNSIAEDSDYRITRLRK